MTLTELFNAIAAAIRSKDGTTAAIPATTFPERIMALSGGGGGGDGSAYVVNVPVNISAEVSVSSEKYYTHALYNGVRLPRIPDSVLASYPYAWIRKNTTNGYYQLVLSTQGFFLESGGGVIADNGSKANPQYTFPIGNTTEVSWANANNTTYYRWTIDNARPCMWSNHDIPSGSASSTTIYFEGTDPVLTD